MNHYSVVLMTCLVQYNLVTSFTFVLLIKHSILHYICSELMKVCALGQSMLLIVVHSLILPHYSAVLMTCLVQYDLGTSVAFVSLIEHSILTISVVS